MIEKPILKRKQCELRFTKNGAFDIPGFKASVAMDYFAGSISLLDARRKLLVGGHLIGYETPEDVFILLKDALKGSERFYEVI